MRCWICDGEMVVGSVTYSAERRHEWWHCIPCNINEPKDDFGLVAS